MATAEKRTLEIRAKLADQLTSPLGRITSSVQQWAKSAAASMQSVFRSVFNLKSGVLALVTTFASLSTLKAFGEQAAELRQLALVTGDTVENLSELQAAFGLVRVDASKFEDALKDLLKRVAEAQQGSEKAVASFEGLGITLQDLEQLGPAQLFERIAAGLERYTTQQEKAVALGKVLPQQYLPVLRVLGAGVREFQKLVTDAREADATISGRQALIAADVEKQFAKVKLSIGGVTRALIEQFGPETSAFLQLLSRGITENKQGIVDLADAIGTGIARAVDLAVRGIINLIGVIEKLPGVSLLDEEMAKKAQVQIAALQEQIRLIQVTNQPAASTLEVSFGSKTPAQIEAAIAPLQQQIEVIRREATLANHLRQEWEGMVAQLRSGAAAVRGAADGGAPAGAGVPWSPEDIARWQEGMASIGSVFTAPQGKPLALTQIADSADDAAAKVRDVGNAMEEARRQAELARRTAFSGDFWASFSDGAAKSVAAWTNFAAAGEEAADRIITGGLDGVVDALSDTLLKLDGSSQAWRRLGQAAVSELSRIAIKMAIVNAASLAFGGGAGVGGLLLAKGGVVQGDMGVPFRAFAAGGVTNGPTMALFGEGSKREAFVPLPDNRSIPVTLTGQDGGTNVHVSYTVNALDARSVQQLLAQHGDTIGDILTGQLSRTRVRQAVQGTR
jgi:hypothetical protein